MNLIASLVVRNELGRYLELAVEHLLAFCDQIVVLDDASDDGTTEFLIDHPSDRLAVVTQPASTFYGHEGRTRQTLLDETLARSPSHVLQVDADEFVADGARLRELLEQDPGRPVWSLPMREVWNVNPNALGIREDGGWRSHPCPVLWRAPERPDRKWQIRDRALACGREPIAVVSMSPRGRDTGVDLLHFGWADEAARAARYERYRLADNGRFHRSKHLDSIMWPDERVTTSDLSWPPGTVFDRLRERFVPVAA